jgi:hypothetical protein
MFVATLASVVVMGLQPAASAQDPRAAQLYVVHGLPGNELDDPIEMLDFPNNLPVDICAGIPGSGTLNCFFANVPFGQIRGPLVFTAGVYQVEVRHADLATPGAGTLIAATSVALRTRESHTALVHISQAGTAVLTDYLNDTSKLGLVNSRVTFRHGARLGPVDMSVQSTLGLPGFAATNLQNPLQSSAATLTSGPYTRFVKAAGQPTDLLTPAPVFLGPRNAYFFYLVGSQTRNTLQVIQHNFIVGPTLQP